MLTLIYPNCDQPTMRMPGAPLAALLVTSRVVAGT